MPIKYTSKVSTTIALASTCSLFLAGCSNNDQIAAKAPPAIPVIVATPTVKEIVVHLESIGTLQPHVLLEIRPQANGELIEVMADEGQNVKKGDPLFKIDPKPYEIKVREAEAQSAIDKASFKAIQKKLDRYKNLVERDLVAKTEWDELKAQLKKAQAVLDLDKARLESANLELEHCTAYSPIDGRVGRVDATEGLIVSSGQSSPLVTIAKIDPLVVEFTVTEKEFPLLPKDSISFEVQSLCAQDTQDCTSGTITFMDNHFDSKTGQLLIKGRIENPDHVMRPGQSVRIKTPIAVTPNAQLVPQKAIRYNQQGPYVYVVNEDLTVAIKQLVLGKEHGTDQIVLEGIGPDERVVLDGHLRLSPGLKVEIKS